MICPLLLAALITHQGYALSLEADDNGTHCREQNCEWYDDGASIGSCSIPRALGALRIIAGALTSSITIRNGDR